MDIKGKVILFGKTGEGKSTIANVLITGGIDEQPFPVGHGMTGCTSRVQTERGRGWTVTDTAGLGEAEGGKVNTEQAEKIIIDFLKSVREGTSSWLEENWESLPSWVKNRGKQNVLITNIPPIDHRPVREKRNKASRAEAMARLEDELCKTFKARGFKYSIPNISKMNDKDLKKESKSVLDYIMMIFNNVIGPMCTAAHFAIAVADICMFLTTIM
ncbi:hypothetical protein BDL97_03G001500 [Sphagnum fallax]|nr:hypothetical protein BDL97_03G001500 [Sphagnum fallax]KAH8966018.1 hypothetical protein BDL97_03G001500 [Sphagnum fallax]